MIIHADNDNLCIATPAKLNLFLEIKEQRDDGYHELETIMSKFSIFDQIRFAPSRSNDFRLTVHAPSGAAPPDVPSDENNLIIKSLRVMRDLAGKSYGATIELFKNIPVQAGLGGASGNAAAAIVAANRMWKLNWSSDRLFDVAGQIGSDVAFFLGDSLARCTGRGEKIQNLRHQCRLNIVAVKPVSGMSTRSIFSRCVVPRDPKNSQTILSFIKSGQVAKIGGALFNRLAEVTAECSDDIARMQLEFDKTNCLGHQLTGSGSCYFGIYRNRKSSIAAAGLLSNRLPDMKVFTGHTLNSRNHCLRT